MLQRFLHTRNARPRTALAFLFTAGILIAAADTRAGWVVHVDPLGNDASPGTAAEPFRSLERALRAAAERPQGEGVIRLNTGIHRIGKTVAIDGKHTGPERGKLTIQGEEGTVLSGFLPVPTAAISVPDAATLARLPEEARVHARVIDLSGIGDGDPGELSRRGFNAVEIEKIAPWLLYSGGQRLTLAEWPDAGTARPEAVIDRGPTRDGEGGPDFYKRGGVFRFRHARMPAWAAEKDLWLEGVLCQDWVWTFNRIAAIDTAKSEVRLAYGEVDGIRMEEWMHPWFRITNALCEISKPGEYHLDTAGKRIVFRPPGQGKDAIRVLAGPPPLLLVRNAADLAIENVAFEGSRGHLLHADGAERLAISRCGFNDAAGYGAVVDGTGIVFRDCRFEDLGAGGILLKGGDEAKLQPSRHLVEHCSFRRLSWWNKVFRPAIMLEGAGHVVRGCLFEDLPHLAIEVKGNDFIIERNLFRRTCLDFRDMGAVYFNLGENPLRRGTVVRDNVFTDIGRQGGRRSAVYIDNGTNGVLVQGNLFDRIGGQEGDWTVMIHGGDHNIVEENSFVDCTLPLHVNFFFNTWGKDMYPEIRKQWEKILSAPEAGPRIAAYPELKEFLSTDRVTPGNNIFRNNRFSHGGENREFLTVGGGPQDRLKVSGNERDPLGTVSGRQVLVDVLRDAGPRPVGSNSAVRP
jgi:hypothetical protein